MATFGETYNPIKKSATNIDEVFGTAPSKESYAQLKTLYDLAVANPGNADITSSYLNAYLQSQQPQESTFQELSGQALADYIAQVEGRGPDPYAETLKKLQETKAQEEAQNAPKRSGFQNWYERFSPTSIYPAMGAATLSDITRGKFNLPSLKSYLQEVNPYGMGNTIGKII
jgi:hypothetical protein